MKKDRDLTKSCVFGFRRSKYDNILVRIGDLQHRPVDILKLLKVYEKKKADFVIGTRKLFEEKNIIWFNTFECIENINNNCVFF